MKRLLYTIPVALLLVPWAVTTLVVLWIALFFDPVALLFLIPIAFFTGGAGYVHRRRAKLGQDFSAALGASLILASPMLVIPLCYEDVRPAHVVDDQDLEEPDDAYYAWH